MAVLCCAQATVPEDLQLRLRAKDLLLQSTKDGRLQGALAVSNSFSNRPGNLHVDPQTFTRELRLFLKWQVVLKNIKADVFKQVSTPAGVYFVWSGYSNLLC